MERIRHPARFIAGNDVPRAGTATSSGRPLSRRHPLAFSRHMHAAANTLRYATVYILSHYASVLDKTLRMLTAYSVSIDSGNNNGMIFDDIFNYKRIQPIQKYFGIQTDMAIGLKCMTHLV